MRRALSALLLLIVPLTIWTGAGIIKAADVSSVPVLLVTNNAASNKFGPYLGEILRAEGINGFATADLSALDAATLSTAKLVVLAETPLSAGQATLFTNYVSGGGRLLAMRPASQIASLFGITPVGSSQTDGYLQIDTTLAVGQGLSSATLQIHGSVDRYTLNTGTTNVATLYSNANTATAYPAAVMANFGSGQTGAFTFDLARSVVNMRQGNAANGNVDMDGDGVLRTIDLFMGSGGSSWVDRNRIPLPQADIQQRLFARMVGQLLNGVTPLPQLWYFPGSAKTMLVLTGDAHANPLSYYTQEINSIAAHNGRITIYLAKGGDIESANSQMQTWRGQGHEFGIHPYWFKSDNYPTPITNLQQGYDDYSGTDGNGGWYASRFTSAKSRTVRNHQVAWQGWTDAADIEVAHGIAMDTNFYHWGPWLKKPDNTWPHGYITGSGQPMKFVRADGTILPLYQQLTQLVDEQLLGAIGGGGFEGLNATGATNVSRQLIDASLAGDYAALMTQFHIDYYNFGDPQVWAEQTLDYATQKGVPIWNADRWLTFTETRHDANFENMSWNGTTNTLSFTLNSSANGQNLSFLLPSVYNGRSLTSVTVGGAAATITPFTVSGQQMSLVSVTSGLRSISAVYGAIASTPTATPITPPTPTSTPIPATPTNTPITPPTPTSTPTPDGTIVQTGASFGAACATANSVTTGGGAVGLAGTFNDDFSAATLDSARWAWGTWSGGTFTPTPGGGSLAISGANGAWLRSQPTFTQGVVEGVLSFGATPWQHFGFGSDSFEGDRYLIFSTIGTSDRLFARTNNSNGEIQTDLGPLPSGLHTYRIEWANLNATSDQISYYIDGALVAQHTTSKPPALYVYLSHNAGTSVPLTVSSINGAPSYAAEGTYISCALDAGQTVSWATLTRVADLPAGSAVTIDARTSNDQATWSAWSAVAGNGALSVPNGRYLQYRLALSTANTAVSPVVRSVTLTYVPAGSTPVPTSTPIPPTATPTPTANLLLNSGFELDANGDTRPDSWSTNTRVTRNNALARSGTYTMRHSATDNANYTISQTVAGITPGTTYSFTGWTNIPATADTFTYRIQLRWLTSANATISTQTIKTYTAATSNWDNAAITLVAPVNAARAQAIMSVTSLGTTIYADDFSLAVAPTMPTPTATSTPIPPTATPTNTPLPPTATPTNTPIPPTPTPTPIGGTITHTIASDFSSCPTATNAIVTQVNDGEVRLAGTTGDEYADAALDTSRWTAGAWTGGSYTPTISGGALLLSGTNGSFVRSNQTRAVTTLESVTQFGAAPWQHIGWGGLNFDDGTYLLFSTFNGSTKLYARSSYQGSEQRTDLGPLPSGFHRYRIERTPQTTSTDLVRYFIDGTLRAQHTVSTLPAMYLYQSYNGGGTGQLSIDRLWVYPSYMASGSFDGCAIDAGLPVTWSTLNWSATIASGTSLQIRTRTSTDGTTWSAWSAPLTTSGQAISSPDGQFLQYRLELDSSDSTLSPIVESISAVYSGIGGQAAFAAPQASGNATTTRRAYLPQVVGVSTPAPTGWPIEQLTPIIYHTGSQVMISWIGDGNPATVRYYLMQIDGARIRPVASVDADRTPRANGTRYELAIESGATYRLEGRRANGTAVSSTVITP